MGFLPGVASRTFRASTHHSVIMSASNEELAVVYASLILHDDGVAITADKLKKLCEAANVDVSSYWYGLFAKAFSKTSLDDIIMNAGSAPAPAAGAPAAAAPPPAAEESDEDMGFGLFD